MIVMGVDNIDWYVAYNKHHISESVAVALGHGRLAEGMSLTEALMAKRELRAFRGGDTIEWGERAAEGPNWIATHAVYDPNLPGIPSYLTHPAASAVLHDGKLVEIRQ